MNTSEIKLSLFREIDNLPDYKLLELQKILKSITTPVGKENPPKAVKLKFGSYKGNVKYMAPDFNAPLADFNDYM